MDPVADVGRGRTVALLEQPLRLRMPRAVERWRYNRIGIRITVGKRADGVGDVRVVVRVFGGLSGVIVGEIDERGEVPLKRMRRWRVPLLEAIRFGALIVRQRLVRNLER